MISRRIVSTVVSLAAGAVLAFASTPAAAQCELSETQKLIASNGAASDNFGNNVAISGNTLVVGAGSRDCAMGPDCGSAYIFRLNGADWVQEDELIPSDPAPGDRFGGDSFGGFVAVDGDRIVVGAAFSDPGGLSNAGAAYVFRFDGTTWVQETKLTAPDAATSDFFGYSVAIRGDRVFLGAPGAGDGGSLYIFRRQGTAWMLETKLLYPEPCGGASFGNAVSAHGDRVLVGAPTNVCQSNVASPPGAAYVFGRVGTNWFLEAQLPWPGGFSTQVLGVAVSLSDDVALVGHTFNDQSAASIYRRSGTTWSYEALLGPLVGNTPYLSVATDGDAAVVAMINTGEAHVFVRDGNNWPEVAQLSATDAALGDMLYPVSMSGDHIVFGNYRDDEAGGIDAGSAYVFDLPHDCNVNGVGDACDIASGFSQDLDGNGYPDECCVPVASPIAEPGAVAKNRYITLEPGNPGCSTALRVTLSSLHHPDPPTSPSSPPQDFVSSQGQVRWVGPPSDFPESSSDGTTFKGAKLQCLPHYMDWSTVGSLHVYGSEILPSSVYDVQAVAIACLPSVEANYSLPPLSVTTARWADVAPPYQQTCAVSGCTPCTAVDCVSQPDALDIVSMVNKFKSLAGAPSKVEAQLQPDAPDPLDDLNALDIVVAVGAFKGFGYAYAGPTACPP